MTSAATTSVTKITGLRTSWRGSSLTKASRDRRAAGSPDRTAMCAIAGCLDMDVVRQKVWPASIAKCSTMGPRARAGKNCRPPRIRMMPMSRPTNSGAVGREGAGRRRHLGLGGQRAGDRQHRHDIGEAAEQHGDAERRVVPGRVGGQAGEGRAVVAGRRGVGVEDLGQPVRAAGADARHRRRAAWPRRR